MTQPTLDNLIELIRSHKAGDAEKSYVAKMFGRGKHKIAQKVGEEATEVIIAALAEGRTHIVNESADLLFHLCMLWEAYGVSPQDVMAELESRMGQSGIDEKASRKADQRD